VKPFLRSGDFWSGLVLAALGVFILVEAHSWVYMAEDGPGAGFFPIWYGGIMVVLSLVLVAMSVLKPSRSAQVRWRDIGRALTCWIAFVACVALMPVAGFAVSFALLTWFIIQGMFRERARIAIPVAVGGALGFYALFELALDLTLPHGILF
jgi:putative tricarboxylic transport membrane protein